MDHRPEATEQTFAEALEANGGDAPSTRLRTCFESLRQRRATLLNSLDFPPLAYILQECIIGLTFTSWGRVFSDITQGWEVGEWHSRLFLV